MSEDDAAQCSGGENEEEREVELFGLGFTPFAEALIESLLFGREGFGGYGGCGVGAGEGFGMSFAGGA